MTRALRIFAAVVAMAALMGADGGCQRKGGVDYSGPLGAIGCKKGKERWVLLSVTRAKTPAGEPAPYTIEVSARAGELSAHFGPEPYVGEPLYHERMCYTSGVLVEISLEVKGAPNHSFACEIIDDLPNRDYVSGEGKVVCKIVTRR